jgi:hypothetical protein
VTEEVRVALVMSNLNYRLIVILDILKIL